MINGAVISNVTLAFRNGVVIFFVRLYYTIAITYTYIRIRTKKRGRGFE